MGDNYVIFTFQLMIKLRVKLCHRGLERTHFPPLCLVRLILKRMGKGCFNEDTPRLTVFLF